MHATPRTIQIIRWLARLLPVPLVLFVIIMNLAPDPVTGELSREISVQQVILALLFPGLYVAGWVLAWWRWERLGGVLMILSFPLFVGYIGLTSGVSRFRAIWLLMGLIFAAPGLLFLLASYLSQRKSMSP